MERELDGKLRYVDAPLVVERSDDVPWSCKRGAYRPLDNGRMVRSSVT
ncbi:hypothetical protein [Mycobacterium leprae]